MKSSLEDSVYNVTPTRCSDVHGHLREKPGKTTPTGKDLWAAPTYSLPWLLGLKTLGLQWPRWAVLAFCPHFTWLLGSLRDLIWLAQDVTFSIWVSSRPTVVPMMS